MPNLIMMDYRMLHISCLEMLKELNESKRFHAIAKIMYSGSMSASQIHECLEAGAQACILKSANLKQIREDAKKMLTYFSINPS